MPLFPEAVLATSGLVRYWRFEEAVGATQAVEETGSGENLAIVDATLEQPGGLSNDEGLAYKFDGSNDRLAGTFSSISVLARPVYVAVMRIETFPPPLEMVWCHGQENNAVQNRYYSSMQFEASNSRIAFNSRRSDGAAILAVVPRSNFPIGEWVLVTHIAQAQRAYINKQAFGNFLTGGTYNTDAELQIGCGSLSGAPTRFFTGRIAEFAVFDGNNAVWNSANAQATVTALYNAMHTIYGEGVIENEATIEARGSLMHLGEATLENNITVEGEGNLVRLPTEFPLKVEVLPSQTQVIIQK